MYVAKRRRYLLHTRIVQEKENRVNDSLFVQISKETEEK